MKSIPALKKEVEKNVSEYITCTKDESSFMKQIFHVCIIEHCVKYIHLYTYTYFWGVVQSEKS